jgi:hypothetical protein
MTDASRGRTPAEAPAAMEPRLPQGGPRPVQTTLIVPLTRKIRRMDAAGAVARTV